MRRTVAVLVASLLFFPGSSAGPNASVQLVGPVECVWGDFCGCEFSEMLYVTVEKLEDRYIATVTLGDPCPYIAMAAFPPLAADCCVFRLSGDWETGFRGGIRFSEIWIGPYGDGTAVAVEFHLFWVFDSAWHYYRGVLPDIHQDEAFGLPV